MGMSHGRLNDILGGRVEEFKESWYSAAARSGTNNELLPEGTYRCEIVHGELFESSRKRTPGYQITFKVLSGECAGRLIMHTLWLTERALSFAQWQLSNLGITRPEQLEEPLPAGLKADVELETKFDDRDREYNRVRSFELVPKVPAGLFDAQAKPRREVAASNPKRKTSAAVPPGDDGGDIPF
jgi:hypothetical protein